MTQGMQGALALRCALSAAEAGYCSCAQPRRCSPCTTSFAPRAYRRSDIPSEQFPSARIVSTNGMLPSFPDHVPFPFANGVYRVQTRVPFRSCGRLYITQRPSMRAPQNGSVPTALRRGLRRRRPSCKRHALGFFMEGFRVGGTASPPCAINGAAKAAISPDDAITKLTEAPWAWNLQGATLIARRPGTYLKWPHGSRWYALASHLRDTAMIRLMPWRTGNRHTLPCQTRDRLTGS
jgi:hypothetical protein